MEEEWREIEEGGRTFVVNISEAGAAEGMLLETREGYGQDTTLIYKQESYEIMGACFAV